MAGASKQCCIGVILQKVSCSYKAAYLLIPGFQIQISDGDLKKNLEVRRKSRYTKVSSTTLVLMFSGSLIQRKNGRSQSALSINIVENKMKSVQLCPRHLAQVLSLFAYSRYTVNAQVFSLRNRPTSLQLESAIRRPLQNMVTSLDNI